MSRVVLAPLEKQRSVVSKLDFTVSKAEQGNEILQRMQIPAIVYPNTDKRLTKYKAMGLMNRRASALS